MSGNLQNSANLQPEMELDMYVIGPILRFSAWPLQLYSWL